MSKLTKLRQQGNGMVRGVRVLLMEESLLGDTGVEGPVVRRPHRPAGELELAAIVLPPQTQPKTFFHQRQRGERGGAEGGPLAGQGSKMVIKELVVRRWPARRRRATQLLLRKSSRAGKEKGRNRDQNQQIRGGRGATLKRRRTERKKRIMI